MIATQKDNREEMFPLVDEEGNIIGAATRGECHNGSKCLHPVVHLHVFNSRGELYLQKRPHWKDIQPGRWDTAVGGHVDLGESVEMALRREAEEELGLTGFTPERLPYYVFESDRERELVFPTVVLTTGKYVPVRKQMADVSGARRKSMKRWEKESSRPILKANTRNFSGMNRTCFYE